MHIPVLLNKTLEYLDPQPGEFIIDGTVDGGGYAVKILEQLGTRGRFLGIDWDKKMIEAIAPKLKIYEQSGVKISLVNDNFVNLKTLLDQLNFGKADGLVLDLGFSSEQLERSGRGFSFLKDEQLLMTYSDVLPPVKEILRSLDMAELVRIIKDFGEERFAQRIAENIKKRERIKPIETSKELSETIIQAVPRNYERGRLHPATRTFMALRIYANRELENLEKILKDLPAILKSAGRVVIVSFHSLEDRLVKNYFRELGKVGEMKILTPKPIRPTREEIRINFRSRSAKLRAAVIL